MRTRGWTLSIVLLLASCALGRTIDLWCNDTDALRLAVDPDGTVLLTHAGAMYNCCPEPILYDVALDAGVMTVTERVLEESPCDCICCFDLKAAVSAVPPGGWTVVLRWLDVESGGWAELVGTIEVPAAGADAVPQAVLSEDPVCISDSGVVPPEATGTWGSVKARYR